MRLRSGCANPARARSGRSRCRLWGGRGPRPDAAFGSEPGDRDAGLSRRRAGSQYAVMRAPFQDGEFPRAGQVRLSQRRRRRIRAGGAARSHGVLPLSPPDRLRGAHAGGVGRARGGPPGTGGSCRDGGDRRQRLVGCGPAARRPGHGRRRRRWSAAARLGSSPGSPASGSRSWTSTPRAPRSHGSLASLPADADVTLSPHDATSRAFSSPSTSSRREGGRRTSAGTRGPPVAGVRPSTPGRLGIRASQVGTVSAARRGRRTPAERLALSLDLLRDPAFDALISGASRFDELPDVIIPTRGRDAARGALPPSPTARRTCSA